MAKFQVLRGIFYWEQEHDLEDFEVVYYDTHREAVLGSLNKAFENYKEIISNTYNQMEEDNNKKIREQICKDINSEERFNYIYNDNYSEYHIKIKAIY